MWQNAPGYSMRMPLAMQKDYQRAHRLSSDVAFYESPRQAPERFL